MCVRSLLIGCTVQPCRVEHIGGTCRNSFARRYARAVGVTGLGCGVCLCARRYARALGVTIPGCCAHSCARSCTRTVGGSERGATCSRVVCFHLGGLPVFLESCRSKYRPGRACLSEGWS